jgi:hypothetical protein
MKKGFSMNKKMCAIFFVVIQGMLFAAESRDSGPKVLLVNERKHKSKATMDVMILHLNTEKKQIDTNSLKAGYYHVLSAGTFYDTQKDVRIAPIRVLGQGLVYDVSLVNEDYAIVHIVRLASTMVPFMVKHEKVANRGQFEEAVEKCKKAGMKESKFIEIEVPSEEKMIEGQSIQH